MDFRSFSLFSSSFVYFCLFYIFFLFSLFCFVFVVLFCFFFCCCCCFFFFLFGFVWAFLLGRGSTEPPCNTFLNLVIINVSSDEI